MDTEIEMQAFIKIHQENNISKDIQEKDICTSDCISSSGQEKNICADLQGNNDSVSTPFLEKLYKQECLFSIMDESKISYLQDKIETVVSSLLTKILQSENYRKKVDRKVSGKLGKFKHPVQISRMVTDKNLLKVGSFYENTKNHYPDEFDFICVLAECDEIDYHLMKKVTSVLIDIFHSWIRKYSQNYITDCLPADGSLEFNGYFEHHGPAAKLEIILKDNDPDFKGRSVFVDISPATKIHLADTLPEEVQVSYADWKDIILKTGSILMVKVYSILNPKHDTEIKMTITESELFVIRNKMSEKHKQVYRLLKFILNGNSLKLERKIKQLVREKYSDFKIRYFRIIMPKVVYNISSYAIKLMMFHHMQQCENFATGTLTNCVNDVLTYTVSLIRTAEGVYEPVSYWRYCWSDDTFSVGVQTMIRQTVEIFDEYRSAREIGDAISKLAVCIGNTAAIEDSEDSEIMDHVPVITKVVDIVQQAIFKNMGREKRFCRLMCLPFGFVIICLMLFLALFFSHPSIKVILYCWKGIEYLENSVYTEPYVPSDIPPKTLKTMLNSALDTDYKTNISRLGNQVFCIAFDTVNSSRLDESQNVSGLYSCRADNRCSVEKMLDDYRIINKSQNLPLWCKQYAFDTKNPLPKLLGSAEQEQIHNVCLHKESCLNVSKLTYEDGDLRRTDIYKCRRKVDCENPVLRDVNLRSCVLYQNNRQYQQNFTRAETEVCCCETDSCYKPYPSKEKEMLFNGLFVALGICIFTLMGLCTLLVIFCRLSKICCWYKPTGRNIVFNQTKSRKGRGS